ncbi:MAG: zinc-binding dehydrogenase [Kofleriaceae bacterium]
MKAVCVTAERTLVVRDLPVPTAPASGHVLLRMMACAINPGDKFFLSAPALPGAVARAHGVVGASGVGTVTAVGDGVPAEWVGRDVAVYRTLAPSEHTIGTWCEIAQMPMRCCALIPTGLEARDYCGSLVNVITAYAFAQQARAEGHRGVLITAGTSATGLALVGIARELGLPSVVVARNASGRAKLRALGVADDDIIVSSDASFDADATATIARRAATAVFDGVGGALLTRLVPHLALGSTVYSYGYLGGYDVPLQLPMTLLVMKALTIRGFNNAASATVRDPDNLAAALRRCGELLALPTSKTPLGKTYSFDQITDAIAHVGKDDGKPVLIP